MKQLEQVRLYTLGVFGIPNPPTVAATQLGVKERGLLGILAASSGRRISRQRLRQLLWPGVDEARSRHSLSQSLYAVNRALPGWIQADKSGVRLALPLELVDMHRARQSIRAGRIDLVKQLLRGRFLEDVDGDAGFADWKDSVNFNFYREIELALVSSLSNCNSLEARSNLEIVAHVLALIPESDALRELERTLYHACLSQNKEAPPALAEIDRSHLLPLMGRHADLGLMTDWFDAACENKGACAVLVGAPGSGKSRLLDEFVATVTGRAMIIRVQCFELERHIGLNPILDLIGPLADGHRLTELPAVYRDALSEVFPQVGLTPDLPKLSKPGAQRRLFEAIVRLIQVEAGERPLVLLIDDIHWSDNSTVSFLHFLARRIGPAQVLVIAAGRPSQAVKMLRESNLVSHLKLEELSANDLNPLQSLSVLERHRVPSSAQLIKLTGGNPFLLTEYVRTLIDNPALSAIRRTISSHDTRDFVRAMLSGLAGSTRLLASGLAAIGRPVEPRFLIAITRASPESFATDVQQLIARRIVTKVGAALAFRHDLLREGVYRLIPPMKREQIHRLVADELRKCDERPGPLAEHYFAAQELETAHEFALRAVSEADRRSALNEAIYFIKLAIRTSSKRDVRCSLHQELAQRCFKLRRYEESARQVQKALAMATFLTAVDHVRLVVLELDILVTLRRISTQDLITHVHELRNSFSNHLTPELNYEILAILIRSAAIETDVERCAEYASEMMKLARSTSGLLAARASTLAARCHSVTTSSSDAIRWVEEVEETLNPHSEAEAAAEIMTNIASVYYAGGRYNRALDLYKRATTCIQSAGALHIWPRNATHMHMLLVEMGDFEHARQLEREIRAGWVDGDAGHHISTLEANVALMHYHLGQIDLMRKHAQMSMQYPEMYVHRITCLGLLGIADLEGGQLSVASARASEITCEGETSVRRFGDFSYVEIFLSRWHVRCGRTSIAADGLRRAIDTASDRDLGGWLRLKLELASVSRRSDPKFAQKEAFWVRDHAREMGAIPTVEKANALIARCG